MSEYQYYQFQAIDQPLSERQQRELRAISTRAEITATSFINTYQWGDLKADPLDLMKKYFDAHVYVANWGTHSLMLKIPKDLFDKEAARPYCAGDSLFVHAHRDHVIVCFETHDESGDFRGDWDSGEGWLASLMPLRDDLMQGDRRSLYLGWLAGIWHESDESEPPLPPGLKELSGPLLTLVDFLCLDPHLVEAAAQPDTGSPPNGPSQQDIATWVAGLDRAQKDEVITQLLSGNDHATKLVAPLRRQFQKAWKKTHGSPEATSSARRTAREIFELAEQLAEAARLREAERLTRKKVRDERKAADERKRYLAELAPKQNEIWRSVESLLSTTDQRSYDQAIRWLNDLRDLAAITSSDATSWEQHIREFRRLYSRKSSLMKRFDKAGFP